ncbi:DedA family protein [Phaeodactylibacter xiamenensis]|uniref:DedA family protein n=1 Tax=Phaeodactylibacter xiamenensis TaxID=1524460 RepID=UPI0024A9576F|nr:DedA family protein [Phaeodactylibacter xiamenensis]
MAEWISSLGYIGAFLGAVLEGEVAFLTAIQATRLGYLNFYYVLLAVFLGAQAVDWSLYLAGRKGGQTAIDRRPKLQPRFNQMATAVEQRSTLLLLVYRFMYGFRIVLPTLFGVAKVPVIRFALFSFISTLLWVLIVGNLGFFFSEPLLHGLAALKSYLPAMLLLLTGGGAFLFFRYQSKL